MKCSVCNKRIMGKAKLVSRIKTATPTMKAYCGCLGRLHTRLSARRVGASKAERLIANLLANR